MLVTVYCIYCRSEKQEEQRQKEAQKKRRKEEDVSFRIEFFVHEMILLTFLQREKMRQEIARKEMRAREQRMKIEEERRKKQVSAH